MRGFAWLVGVLGVSANLTHCSLNIYREDLDFSDILKVIYKTSWLVLYCFYKRISFLFDPKVYFLERYFNTCCDCYPILKIFQII